jgi:hypothetical protein
LAIGILFGLTVTVALDVLVHPLFVTVTVYVVVVVGATVIAAVVALVLHKYVPPPVAVNVVFSLRQIFKSPVMVTTGFGLTVTVREVDTAQPLLVTVTTYVVVVVGFTVILAVVCTGVVFHAYVDPEGAPVTVSVTGSPAQIGAGVLTVNVGNGLTVTVADSVSEQPIALVTVTVYVVLLAGVTVIDAVVAPVLHAKTVPPAAVSVVLAP